MGIHIRRAIKDDIPGIAKVHVDSWIRRWGSRKNWYI